jgi:type 1 glutamine amidotransferase
MSENPGVKILLLVGGSHHDDPEMRATFMDFLGRPENFEVTMSEDMDVLTKENLAGYDVIINTTTDREPTDEQHYALLDAVAGGKGFLAIHGALASFWNSEAYFGMIGGRLYGKVRKDREEGYTVQIDIPSHMAKGWKTEDHPITMGIEGYEVQDEIFVLEGDQTQWHVLARLFGNAAMYTKTFGKGRVFVTILGHDATELGRPTYQTLILNAVEWVCRLR